MQNENSYNTDSLNTANKETRRTRTSRNFSKDTKRKKTLLSSHRGKLRSLKIPRVSHLVHQLQHAFKNKQVTLPGVRLDEALDALERLPEAQRGPVLVVHHGDAVLHPVVLLGFSAHVAAPEVEDADAGLELGQNAEVLGRGPGTHDRVVLHMRCCAGYVFLGKAR